MYKEHIKDFSSLLKPHGQMQDADYARFFGTERLSFHWVHLPAGTRSSFPHAESLEEEVIYVHAGFPDVWIDGYLYRLKPGLVIGFPSGTGIAHCFINNTQEMCQLIVLEEKTKKENKCAFPLNPELKEKYSNIWWDSNPDKKLGPHNAEVGNLNYSKDYKEISFIYDVYSELREDQGSYKGDVEKFSLGVRLTSKINLKALGVWHEQLSAGRRSSWPHSHKKEEEACILLKGEVQVWLNGFMHKLQVGDAVYFKPGIGLAHVLINDSDEPAEFIGIGEVADFGDQEKVFYPLQDVRNQQCLEKNRLWQNPPRLAFGEHHGIPKNSLSMITELSSVAEFLQRVEKLLYPHEAEYGLLLGLCEMKLNNKDKSDSFRYFVSEELGEVVGAALLTEKSLIIPCLPANRILPFVDFFIKNEIIIPEVVGNSFSAECFTRLYAQKLNLDFQLAMDQKIYALEQVQWRQNRNYQLEIAKQQNQDQVLEFFSGFCSEALPNEIHELEKMQKFIEAKIKNQEIYVLLNPEKEIVSMNFVGRPTKNGISISGVYTPKVYRGNGYASAVVALTSLKMLELGKKFCVLYTDTSNPTSNSIYQKIGYQEIAMSRHYLLKNKIKN